MNIRNEEKKKNNNGEEGEVGKHKASLNMNLKKKGGDVLASDVHSLIQDAPPLLSVLRCRRVFPSFGN